MRGGGGASCKGGGKLETAPSPAAMSVVLLPSSGLFFFFFSRPYPVHDKGRKSFELLPSHGRTGLSGHSSVQMGGSEFSSWLDVQFSPENSYEKSTFKSVGRLL